MATSILEKIGDGFIGTNIKRFIGCKEIYFEPIQLDTAHRFISQYIFYYAKMELLFVVGSLNPVFFENPFFKDALSSFIQRTENDSVKIICGKDLSLIEQENPFLYGLSIDQLLEIYKTPERPTYHFICFDGHGLSIEGLHNQGVPPESYFVEFAKAAKRYREKFYKLINSGQAVKIL